MTHADACLDPSCRWLGLRDEREPAPLRCPRCGSALMQPARPPVRLVELVRRYDPLMDA
jgi:DNA-directed RNA polymerase subunit RPC12/RpoP